jgi:hypothetical protein
VTHSGDLLSAYLDDELDLDTRSQVAAHLEACAECRTELTDVQSAAVAIRSLPALEPPPGLVPTPAPWRRRRRLQAFGAAGVGVAALAAIVLGVSIIGSDGDPQVAAADTVPVALAGMPEVPAGDRTVTGQQRVQALDAAFRTMDGVEEMDMTTAGTSADVEVMMHDEPIKVRAGMWDGVAADYIAVMTPAEGVVGLFIADEAGTQMAFFYCEHSWYRVETGSGQAPPMDAVVSLRNALGCSG